MTTVDNQRSVLLVEGKDDESTVRHLLRWHDIGYGERNPPPPLPIPNAPGDGVKGVLSAIAVSVRSSTGRSAGFVLDADSQPLRRWAAVASRLSQVGVPVPDQIPAGGFVGESPDYGTRVGVWIMPDNLRKGALEEFLADLVECVVKRFCLHSLSSARHFDFNFRPCPVFDGPGKTTITNQLISDTHL